MICSIDASTKSGGELLPPMDVAMLSTWNPNKNQREARVSKINILIKYKLEKKKPNTYSEGKTETFYASYIYYGWSISEYSLLTSSQTSRNS